MFNVSIHVESNPTQSQQMYVFPNESFYVKLCEKKLSQLSFAPLSNFIDSEWKKKLFRFFQVK